jgi:hypothetical protein
MRGWATRSELWFTACASVQLTEINTFFTSTPTVALLEKVICCGCTRLARQANINEDNEIFSLVT